MLKPSTGMLCAMLVTLALVAQPLGQLSHTAASTLVGPKAYYLALGDSVTYGEQPNGDVSHGFADDLFQQYLKPRGTTTLVNMACVHETTITFMHGGCPNASSVKTSYGSSGSQLAAALAFIKAHQGQVSPVTLEIGAADVDVDVDPTKQPCGYNSIKALIDGGTAISNVDSILSQLKTALNGSGDLVLLDYFDPYQNICPSLAQNLQTFNLNLSEKAQKYGAIFVDVYAAFGGSATPNPNLCNYTWTYGCSSPPDIDANTQGYQVIATAVETALGYPAPPSSTGSPTATAAAGTPPAATPTPGAGAPTPIPIIVLPDPSTPKHSSCARTSHLALSAVLHSRDVTSGAIMTARIRTVPLARVTVTVLVQTSKVVTTGTGKKRKKVVRVTTLYHTAYAAGANTTGQVTARIVIGYRVAKRTDALLRVVASHGCGAASLTDHIFIMPGHGA